MLRGKISSLKKVIVPLQKVIIGVFNQTSITCSGAQHQGWFGKGERIGGREGKEEKSIILKVDVKKRICPVSKRIGNMWWFRLFLSQFNIWLWLFIWLWLRTEQSRKERDIRAAWWVVSQTNHKDLVLALELNHRASAVASKDWPVISGLAFIMWFCLLFVSKVWKTSVLLPCCNKGFQSCLVLLF